LDLLIQAVLVHLLNTRKLKFSQKASSDDQQSTSLSSTANSSVCLQLSCLICSFSAKNCTFRWSYWRCEILTSIFPNLCHPYQLLNIVSKMFANCAKKSDYDIAMFWCKLVHNVGKHHREILTDGLKVLGLRKICMPWRWRNSVENSWFIFASYKTRIQMLCFIGVTQLALNK
jgi:hypothetical protein